MNVPSYYRNMYMQVMGLLFCCICLASCARASEVAEDGVKYRSLIYPGANYMFVKGNGLEPGVWGEMHSSFSDVVLPVMDCKADPDQFCIKVTGLFQLGYSCTMLEGGDSLVIGDWSYKVVDISLTGREWLVEARGFVTKASKIAASWNFILSQEDGITDLIQVRSVNDGGEFQAVTAWHSSGPGFGQISEACKVGSSGS